MNDTLGYVLVALAILNLVGMLLLCVRVGRGSGAGSVPPTTVAEPVVGEPVASVPTIDPEALAAVLRRLDTRLGDIEDQVSRTPTFSAVGEAGGNADKALALAQRLARQGASPQDIAETCGISLTEAELLHRLHSVR